MNRVKGYRRARKTRGVLGNVGAVTDPTATLLWAACRRAPAVDEITSALANGADLDRAAEVALSQRVSPLLWRALNAAGVAGDGQRWAAQLERDSARCHAQSRLSLPRIGQLALAPLAKAGCAPLVIKGASLAGRYPDPALRPMDDVDLILPVDQIEPGIAALVAAGWKRLPTPERRPHEVDLTHALLPGLPIDLHRSLAWWRTRANRLTSDHLWAARQPVTLYGAPVFGLPTELELVMLAAHAAKPFHVFGRLLWSADIAMVISGAEATGGVDWAEVERLSEEMRCPTAVAIALNHADRMGAASPPELRRVRGGRERLAGLNPVLSSDWPLETRDSAIRMSLRYLLVDERRAQFTLLVSDILGKEGPVKAVRRGAVLSGRLARRTWRLALGRPRPSERSREQSRDLVKP